MRALSFVCSCSFLLSACIIPFPSPAVEIKGLINAMLFYLHLVEIALTPAINLGEMTGLSGIPDVDPVNDFCRNYIFSNGDPGINATPPHIVIGYHIDILMHLVKIRIPFSIHIFPMRGIGIRVVSMEGLLDRHGNVPMIITILCMDQATGR